jgi:uncharacterized protein Yka (UPF0111/DUF47 family)
MLTDAVNELQQDIERLQDQNEQAGRRREFEQIREALKDTRENLQDLVQRRVLFARNGIPCEYDGSKLTKTLAQLETVRDRFENDPQWIIDESLRQSLLDWIDRHEKPLRKAINEAWDDYYRTSVSNISENLLDALEGVSGFDEAVDRIRTLMSEIESWHRNPPTTQSELDEFEEKTQELESTWEEIQSDELSEDVKQFLQETVSGGAPLHLVTDSVRGWLKEHDLYDGATVHLGGLS